MKMFDINTVYKYILHAPQHSWMFCQQDILNQKWSMKFSAQKHKYQQFVSFKSVKKHHYMQFHVCISDIFSNLIVTVTEKIGYS